MLSVVVVGSMLAAGAASAQPVTAVAVNRAKSEWPAAQKVGTRSAYEQFIRDHPQSPLAREAEQGIQRIQANEAYTALAGRDASVAELESYLLAYPVSEHAAAAHGRARQRWEKDRLAAVDAKLAAALSAGTVPALQAFIERNPTSNKLGEARGALQPLMPNAAYASIKAALAQDISTGERASKQPRTTPRPQFQLVFFHARTSESETHIVFKDHEHNYSKVTARSKPVEKLPPSFELLELRGIEPWATFVLYISDKDLSDVNGLELSWSSVFRWFMEARCSALKLALCNAQQAAYLRPDTYTPAMKATWNAAFMPTLQDMTRRRPEFGTQPRYTSAPVPRWEDGAFHAGYVGLLCGHVAGPPGALPQAAVATLAAIDTPAGNRCVFASGLALGAPQR